MAKALVRGLLAVVVVLASLATWTTSGSAQTCPNGAYYNTSHQRVCSPVAASSAPAGSTALCNDGTWSQSQSRSGTCSSHSGVNFFLADVAPAEQTTAATAPAGTVSANPAVAASATAPAVAATGLSHTPQFVEMALILICLGTALVLEARAREGLDRLKR